MKKVSRSRKSEAEGKDSAPASTYAKRHGRYTKFGEAGEARPTDIRK